MDNQFAKCWFCKNSDVDKDCYFELNLYKILDRKKQYVVMGTRYKQEYLMHTVNIPLCKKCYKSSQNFYSLVLIIWLLLGSAMFYIMFSNIDKSYETTTRILAIAVAAFSSFAMSAITVGGLGLIFDFFVTKKDAKAATYPEAQKFLLNGWNLGSKPSYKWN